MQAPLEGFPLQLMSGIFNFVGGLIVLRGLYALINSLRVQFDGRPPHPRRPGQQQGRCLSIRSIEIKHNGSSQSGNTHHINYQVITKTASGNIYWPKGWMRIVRRNGWWSILER